MSGVAATSLLSIIKFFLFRFLWWRLQSIRDCHIMSSGLFKLPGGKSYTREHQLCHTLYAHCVVFFVLSGIRSSIARARSLSRTGAPKRSSFSFFDNAKSSWSSKSCMGRSKGAKAKASMSNSGNLAAIR